VCGVERILFAYCVGVEVITGLVLCAGGEITGWVLCVDGQ